MLERNRRPVTVERLQRALDWLEFRVLLEDGTDALSWPWWLSLNARRLQMHTNGNLPATTAYHG